MCQLKRIEEYNHLLGLFDFKRYGVRGLQGLCLALPDLLLSFELISSVSKFRTVST
jgi:hypothetical protein